jgi:(p)ppGpp synthase/HD superfamily hydrolase
MVFGHNIQNAIKFALKTHEILQKQKRKGKDIPYVVHPLIVGLLLARAGCSDDVIAAGILHDTIEDSNPKKPVTKKLIEEKFNKRIATLVSNVTEDMLLPWEARKRHSIESIAALDRDSQLIKSADVLANTSELIHDINKYGEEVFARFARGKKPVLEHYITVIDALKKASVDLPSKHPNPFRKELLQNAKKLKSYL